MEEAAEEGAEQAAKEAFFLPQTRHKRARHSDVIFWVFFSCFPAAEEDAEQAAEKAEVIG